MLLPANILQTTAEFKGTIRLYMGSTVMVMNTRLMEKFYFNLSNWPSNFNCRTWHPKNVLVKV